MESAKKPRCSTRKGEEMIIEQILDKKEVQTGLAVKVDGKRVDYKRREHGLSYEFVIGIGEDKDWCKDVKEARETVNKLVKAMVSQSYDHGAQWRITELQEDTTGVSRYEQYAAIVSFRVRDAM